eukprot:361289-Chlamydomonas_euryale.AAC.1
MCCGPSTCGCVPTWARRRLASACDACVDACADTVDRAARCVEPFMCMGAAMLVLADAWLFFSGPVLRGAGRGGGPAGAAAVALHGAFAAWLLGNVLLNHALCTFSTPGTTKEEDMQVGQKRGGEGLIGGSEGVGQTGEMGWFGCMSGGRGGCKGGGGSVAVMHQSATGTEVHVDAWPNARMNAERMAERADEC